MGKFIREFKNTKTLSGCDIFKKEIKPCCLSGEVFPAVREGTIDFYVKGGGRVLRRTAETYYTNGGYLGRKDGEPSKDVNWQKYNKNIDFKTLKNNCEKHSKNVKGERKEVSELFAPFSFLNKNEGLVLIDIEARFGGTKTHDADMVDLVFYDVKSKSLFFVEVKDRYDSRCRKAEGTPEVVEQVKKYHNQLSEECLKKNILKQYEKAINVMSSLFDKDFSETFKLEEIVQDVPLLIIGDTKTKSNHSNDNWLEPLLEKKDKVQPKDGVIVVDGRDALNNKNFKALEKLLLKSVGIEK